MMSLYLDIGVERQSLQRIARTATPVRWFDPIVAEIPQCRTGPLLDLEEWLHTRLHLHFATHFVEIRNPGRARGISIR